MHLRVEDVDALVLGAALLGSGGGGSTVAFGNLLRRRLGSQAIALHRPDELSDGLVVPVGVVGATTVLTEKLPRGTEFVTAVSAISRWTAHQPAAIMGMEAGGVNGLTGVLTALEMGAPYIDADLMGRAFPRLDQLTWAVEGVPVSPAAIVGTSGQVLIVDSVSATALEGLARGTLRELGGWAAIALSPRPITELSHSSVLGAAERAVRLGYALRSLPEAASPPQIEAAVGGRVLGHGRVFDVNRQRVDDGTFGHGHISLMDLGAAKVIRLECQNEYLLASVNGELESQVPDILCLLERRTLQPVAVDRVREGDELIALHLPGPSWWWASEVRRRKVGLDTYGIQVPWNERRNH